MTGREPKEWWESIRLDIIPEAGCGDFINRSGILDFNLDREKPRIFKNRKDMDRFGFKWPFRGFVENTL